MTAKEYKDKTKELQQLAKEYRSERDIEKQDVISKKLESFGVRNLNTSTGCWAIAF
jgi:hypothetical protein